MTQTKKIINRPLYFVRIQGTPEPLVVGFTPNFVHNYL